MDNEIKSKIKVATLKALTKRKARGKALGNPPYGYRWKNGTHAPNATEQAAIKCVRIIRVFRWASWEVVAFCLNKEGHRTRRGTLWTKQSACETFRKVKTPVDDVFKKIIMGQPLTDGDKWFLNQAKPSKTKLFKSSVAKKSPHPFGKPRTL